MLPATSYQFVVVATVLWKHWTAKTIIGIFSRANLRTRISVHDAMVRWVNAAACLSWCFGGWFDEDGRMIETSTRYIYNHRRQIVDNKAIRCYNAVDLRLLTIHPPWLFAIGLYTLRLNGNSNFPFDFVTKFIVKSVHNGHISDCLHISFLKNHCIAKKLLVTQGNKNIFGNKKVGPQCRCSNWFERHLTLRICSFAQTPEAARLYGIISSFCL